MTDADRQASLKLILLLHVVDDATYKRHQSVCEQTRETAVKTLWFSTWKKDRNTSSVFPSA